MDIAQQGVICSLSWGEDDQQLLSINEPSDDMYKVRTYVLENDGQGFNNSTVTPTTFCESSNASAAGSRKNQREMPIRILRGDACDRHNLNGQRRIRQTIL